VRPGGWRPGGGTGRRGGLAGMFRNCILRLEQAATISRSNERRYLHNGNERASRECGRYAAEYEAGAQALRELEARAAAERARAEDVAFEPAESTPGCVTDAGGEGAARVDG